MTLEEPLDSVADQDSFLRFAEALRADKKDEDKQQKRKVSNSYSHGWNGWLTNGIEDYLESAIAWAQDSDFGERLEPGAIPWKKFALFQCGRKIYE